MAAHAVCLFALGDVPMLGPSDLTGRARKAQFVHPARGAIRGFNGDISAHLCAWYRFLKLEPSLPEWAAI